MNKHSSTELPYTFSGSHSQDTFLQHVDPVFLSLILKNTRAECPMKLTTSNYHLQFFFFFFFARDKTKSLKYKIFILKMSL